MFEKPVYLRLVELGLDTPGNAAFPRRLEPMLPVLGREPFTDPNWLMEAKWDGIRTLAFVHDGVATLRGRGGRDLTGRFYPVANRLSVFPTSLVVDGEMVVLDEHGRPSLEAVSAWRGRRGVLSYKVFDCLYLHGHALLARPLDERRRVLEAVQQALNGPAVQVTPVLEGADGRVAFQTAIKLGLEGLIAKRRSSPYRPGARSDDWVKLPARPRDEFLVAGFFLRQRRLARLIVAEQGAGGKPVYAGTVDCSLPDELRSELLTRLRGLERKRPPFGRVPAVDDTPANQAADRDPHWVKPEVVVEIETGRRDATGLAGAVLKGLRDDKTATR